jgi:hypothetical protein
MQHGVYQRCTVHQRQQHGVYQRCTLHGHHRSKVLAVTAAAVRKEIKLPWVWHVVICWGAAKTRAFAGKGR